MILSPLVEAKDAPVGRRDALDAEQDDHRVRRAAAVVRGEACPEGERPLFPEDPRRAVREPLVGHVALAVGLLVLLPHETTQAT